MNWLAAGMLAGLAMGYAQAKPSADLVLFNGKVLTVDSAFSIRSALVVKDGKVLAVGDDRLAKRYDAATRIDLKGARKNNFTYSSGVEPARQYTG